MQLYESSLCGSCGQSAVHAFDPMNSGEFEIKDDVVCLGCEVSEQHAESERKLPAGTKSYINNRMSDD